MLADDTKRTRHDVSAVARNCTLIGGESTDDRDPIPGAQIVTARRSYWPVPHQTVSAPYVTDVDSSVCDRCS